jgi:prefoldin subunit 5
MRAQRVWKTVGADKYNTEIERLHSELDSFNKRIAELEQLRSESSTIEALKASALMLSRQIDELRSSIATEQLACLLAK